MLIITCVVWVWVSVLYLANKWVIWIWVSYYVSFFKKEVSDCVSECLDNSVNNMDLGII